MKATPQTLLVMLWAVCLGCAGVPSSASAPAKLPIEIAIEDAQGNQIAIADDLVELDDLEQGGRTSQTLFVRNVSPSAVMVKHAASSCECLTFDGLPAEIARGAVAQVEMQVDLERERSFTGEMEVVVSLSVGSSGTEWPSVPLKVRFRVRPREIPPQ